MRGFENVKMNPSSGFYLPSKRLNNLKIGEFENLKMKPFEWFLPSLEVVD